MAYNPNIPQPANKLKNSQPQILGNFQDIDTLINVNHVGFNVADAGKHKFIQMPQQGGLTNTGALEVALTCLTGTNSSIPELSFRRQNNGASIAITEGLNGGPQRGWATLGNGLIIKWDFVNVGSGSGRHQSTVTWSSGATWRAFASTPFFVVGSVVTSSATSSLICNFNASASNALTAAFRMTPASSYGNESGNYSAYTLTAFAIGVGV